MADGLKVRVEGLTPTLRRYRDLAKAAPAVTGRALFGEGEEIMRRSKQIVPVDTGALRASGHVVPPKPQRFPVIVELAYGGPSAPYALAVHEKMEVKHTNGQAKYLEVPFKARQTGMSQRIAKAMRTSFEQLRLLGTTQKPS